MTSSFNYYINDYILANFYKELNEVPYMDHQWAPQLKCEKSNIRNKTNLSRSIITFGFGTIFIARIIQMCTMLGFYYLEPNSKHISSTVSKFIMPLFVTFTIVLGFAIIIAAFHNYKSYLCRVCDVIICLLYIASSMSSSIYLGKIVYSGISDTYFWLWIFSIFFQIIEYGFIITLVVYSLLKLIHMINYSYNNIDSQSQLIVNATYCNYTIETQKQSNFYSTLAHNLPINQNSIYYEYPSYSYSSSTDSSLESIA